MYYLEQVVSTTGAVTMKLKQYSRTGEWHMQNKMSFLFTTVTLTFANPQTPSVSEEV